MFTFSEPPAMFAFSESECEVVTRRRRRGEGRREHPEATVQSRQGEKANGLRRICSDSFRPRREELNKRRIHVFRALEALGITSRVYLGHEQRGHDRPEAQVAGGFRQGVGQAPLISFSHEP